MAKPTKDKATANLKRTINASAAEMAKQVQKYIAKCQKDIKDAAKQGKMATDGSREALVYTAMEANAKALKNSLDKTLAQLTQSAAKSGNAKAVQQSDGVITQFDEEHLRNYIERVNPKNGPTLAAVYTTAMNASAKTALRQTATQVFTQGAAAGLTMREQMRLFQQTWAERCKDADPYRFVDRRGRRWENARYIQMLTRTTAQRVETAAFCDTMLASGFPLARISNDSGNDCGICAQWEGRLIDLSAGHQLGSGTYTLQEAREAGLFHPNCTHRLEYVSVSEIPDAIMAKIKDKIGVPNAFGKPGEAVKPDLPNKKQTQQHIKQVEKAAEEKAKEPIDPLSPEAIEEAMLQGDPLGGTTGARLITAPDGKKYVVKAGASEAHVQNEMAADALYKAAGINVPAFRAVRSTSGKLYKVAEFIEGKDLQSWWDKASPADRKQMTNKLAQGLDVDAMLGNCDVIGASGDNILVDKDGNPWRIDNGGSMGYRAQGAKKTGDQWNQWTDDFFSIATSPNNKKYVGQTSAGGRLMRAARRDWETLTKDLPKEDRDAILARLKEVKEQAARANDLIDGDYTYEYSDSVLKAANDLCKSGYREAVPKRIDEGDFGNCRPDYHSTQKSLTERIIDYIGQKDWNDYIAQWTESQADDSWDPLAIKRKVVEFHAMGIDAETLDEAAAEMDGIWNGVTKDGGNWRARSFKEVRGSMTEDQIERFAEIDAKMRAATMLMLENADFNGNVRDKRKVVLFRTEAEEAVFGDKKPTEKKIANYDTSAAESFSFNETVYVYGDCAIACAVPYSRINTTYFMDRNKDGKVMFAGDYQKEFNVNAIGLDRVFISRDEKMHTTDEIMQDPEIMHSLGLT